MYDIKLGNISMKNDSLLIYDRVLGRMLCYTEEGEFRSFLNKTEVKAEILYKTDNCFWGISIFCDHEFDNHYCVMYDNEGSCIDKYLTLPSHYLGYDYHVGYTDLSYLYHDTLRFMLVHDYSLFSLTRNGLESTYRFKSDREMPKDYFDGMTGVEKMNPEVYAKTWAECRNFVLPMNPVRKELEYAVKTALNELGVKSRSTAPRTPAPRSSAPRKSPSGHTGRL